MYGSVSYCHRILDAGTYATTTTTTTTAMAAAATTTTTATETEATRTTRCNTKPTTGSV